MLRSVCLSTPMTNKYYHKMFFDNGYGLSIVSHSFSYGGDRGLFEVALIDQDGDLIYNDALGFNDVQGFLNFHNVSELITQISQLSPRQVEVNML